jgi:aldose 1-epimerase
VNTGVIQCREFGCFDGLRARLFTLSNNYLESQITDYAGALVALSVPDRFGRAGPVVLGFGDVVAYAQTQGNFGALLGRTANRLDGGRVVVDGREYLLSKNERDATLHGGAKGFGKRLWSVGSVDERRIVLHLLSADGDEGFPGEVKVRAEYRLDGTDLRLVFDAETTKPTPLSLSAHPYFNLDASDDCLDHRLEIFAAEFLPTDRRQIPTGEKRPVAGTPFDFRAPHVIGARIRDLDPQLRYGRGYDHYFILPEDGAGPLRLAARVSAATSGRVLEILTTQRGVQFYSGNNLDGSAPGRGGLYRQSAGFAIEPQAYPNAPNQAGFPSTILRPGERYHEEIVYRFRADHEGAAL